MTFHRRYCSIISLLFLVAAGKTEAFSTSTGRSSLAPSLTRKTSSGQTSSLYMSVPNSFDVLTSGLASIFCLPRGVTVSSPKSNSNTRIAKLYDVENSNACREVRERITELDLVVEQVIPVAEGSKNSMPGSEAPILVVSISGDDDDSSSEETIAGTDAILSYLKKSFSNGSGTSQTSGDDLEDVQEKLKSAGLYLAGWMRLGRGKTVSPSVGTAKKPEKPLVLYSYEGNQFCRLVREVLTELDIVYELRSAGKESPRRAELASITGGSSQCPYLIDPNTGVSMPESADICEYLYKTYASYTPPNELLEWTSNNVMSLAKPIFKVLAPLQASAGEDDDSNYDQKLKTVTKEIEEETTSSPVVVYTYDLSPFSSETTLVLDRLGVDYKKISLGKEWLPGLIAENGAIKRAALLEMTGQSSLPHIFVNGKPIGGLFSGSPGLVPMLQKGDFSVDTAATPTETTDTVDTAEDISLDTSDAFQ